MAVFTNARIFDGREMLAGTHDVTLDGNRIASNPDPDAAPPRAGDLAAVIDARDALVVGGELDAAGDVDGIALVVQPAHHQQAERAHLELDDLGGHLEEDQLAIAVWLFHRLDRCRRACRRKSAL